MIHKLKKNFKALKTAIRKCLEKREVPVDDVADALTSLSPDDDDHHKMFLQKRVTELVTAKNLSVLFVTMNFHWNYLDPSLLETLVSDFDLTEFKTQMDTYKSELRAFRKRTPLSLFCETQTKQVQPPAGFEKIVAKFKWPDTVKLEVVEQFRKAYASRYNLHDFAMMIAEARRGSFIITWFIPVSVTDKLTKNLPTAVLEIYSTTKLTIAGTCVYDSQTKEVRLYTKVRAV